MDRFRLGPTSFVRRIQLSFLASRSRLAYNETTLDASGNRPATSSDHLIALVFFTGLLCSIMLSLPKDSKLISVQT